MSKTPTTTSIVRDLSDTNPAYRDTETARKMLRRGKRLDQPGGERHDGSLR